MFVLMRAATYGTLFVGFLLVFLPGRVLEWSGVRRPASLGLTQVLGLAVVVLGAALALSGAALFYGSWPLLAYTALFLLITHLFVRLYEEPVLRRLFGTEYEEYCRGVRRWRPSLRSR